MIVRPEDLNVYPNLKPQKMGRKSETRIIFGKKSWTSQGCYLWITCTSQFGIIWFHNYGFLWQHKFVEENDPKKVEQSAQNGSPTSINSTALHLRPESCRGSEVWKSVCVCGRVVVFGDRPSSESDDRPAQDGAAHVACCVCLPLGASMRRERRATFRGGQLAPVPAAQFR